MPARSLLPQTMRQRCRPARPRAVFAGLSTQLGCRPHSARATLVEEVGHRLAAARRSASTMPSASAATSSGTDSAQQVRARGPAVRHRHPRHVAGARPARRAASPRPRRPRPGHAAADGLGAQASVSAVRPELDTASTRSSGADPGRQRPAADPLDRDRAPRTGRRLQHVAGDARPAHAGHDHRARAARPPRAAPSRGARWPHQRLRAPGRRPSATAPQHVPRGRPPPRRRRASSSDHSSTAAGSVGRHRGRRSRERAGDASSTSSTGMPSRTG